MTEIFEGFLNRVRRNGLARAHNFFVKVDVGTAKPPFRANTGRFFPSDQGASENNLFTTERLKSLSFMCNQVLLPDREITTLDFTVKPGVTQKIASYQTFGQMLPMTFYCSPDLNEKRFFENWMNLVINPISRNANYYDEYAKFNTITVFVLPKFFSGSFVDENTVDENGNPLYYIKFYECYPTKITSSELANSKEEDLLELGVEIAYKYFRTVTDINFPEGLGHNSFNTSEVGSLDQL